MTQKKALIWVGMQVDLLPGGAAEVPDSERLVAVFNRISPDFDLVVAANFYLPADHLSFAGNHLWRKPGQVIEVEGIPTELKIMYCVQESFGAEFLPGMQTGQISKVFFMGQHKSYAPHSAFFDAGQRVTGLGDFLKEKEINEVYLAGMSLEGEVKNSVFDAQSLGFQVVVLKEGCAARNIDLAEDIFVELSAAGVLI